MHVAGIVAIKYTKSIFAPLLKKGREGKRRARVDDGGAAWCAPGRVVVEVILGAALRLRVDGARHGVAVGRLARVLAHGHLVRRVAAVREAQLRATDAVKYLKKRWRGSFLDFVKLVSPPMHAHGIAATKHT